MAMTFDGQRSSCMHRSDVAGMCGRTSLDVEKTGQCAKEEVSSSLLGKLAPPFLCYKHIPNIILLGSTCGNSTACCLLNQEACCSPLLYLASLLPPPPTHSWRKLVQHASVLRKR